MARGPNPLGFRAGGTGLGLVASTDLMDANQLYLITRQLHSLQKSSAACSDPLSLS